MIDTKHRIATVLILLLLTLNLIAETGPEGAIMNFTGQVYVKKIGKHFTESALINVRLAPGTNIQTGIDSSCIVLLATDRLVKIGPSAIYVVGTNDAGEPLHLNSNGTANESLWNKYLDRWNSSKKSVADSSVLGAIRAANDSKVPENTVLSESDQTTLAQALTAITSNEPGSPEQTLAALECELYGQDAQAETFWRTAADQEQNSSHKKQLLTFLFDLYVQTGCKNLANSVQQELNTLP